MSKKFKHLDLSPHWQQYFSKYPQGYTIIENLIDWLSQVNKMVDSYNELTEHVDNFTEAVDNTTDGFREELDTFLGQFDDNLTQTVVTTLLEWQASGFLNIVINQVLETKYHEMNERLSTQLTQKINKNRGDVEEQDLSQSLREILHGDRPLPIAEVDSILTENIVDGQVTTQKTDFIESNNLWGGKYREGIYLLLDEDTIRHDSTQNNFSVIIPAKSNATYAITKKEGGNRFIVSAVSEIPQDNQDLSTLVTHNILSYADQNTLIQAEDEHTITLTTPENTNYLVAYVSARTNPPKVIINEGAKPTEEKLGFMSKLEGFPKLIKSEKNHFDGEYVEGYFTKLIEEPIYSLRKNNENFDGRLAIFSGVGGQTWSLSFPDEDNNRLRIGVSEHPVSILSVTLDYTELNRVQDIIYDGISDGNKHQHTFTLSKNQNYLYIYASSEGHEPRLQLEKGEVVTGYETPYSIPQELMGTSKQIISSPQYIFADDLVGVYDVDTVENFDDPTNVQTSEVISDYDELQSAFPEYISKKESIGTSQGGEDIYYYRFMPHVLDSDRPIEIPKIIIISGTHGDEKNSVFSTLNFIKKMCYDWRDDKILEFFRFNVEFIIVPVFNVDGFNIHTRRTLSDVDLNRDFPSGWENIWSNGDFPASQKETQLMMSFLESQRDVDFVIDNHRVNWYDDDYVTYAICEDPVINEVANKTQNLLGRKWAKDYEFFPQDENHKHGYTTEHIPGSMIKYIDDVGISRAVVLETTWEVQWNPNWERYDDLSVLIGTEWLGNMLKGLMNTLQ